MLLWLSRRTHTQRTPAGGDRRPPSSTRWRHEPARRPAASWSRVAEPSKKNTHFYASTRALRRPACAPDVCDLRVVLDNENATSSSGLSSQGFKSWLASERSNLTYLSETNSLVIRYLRTRRNFERPRTFLHGGAVWREDRARGKLELSSAQRSTPFERARFTPRVAQGAAPCRGKSPLRLSIILRAPNLISWNRRARETKRLFAPS